MLHSQVVVHLRRSVCLTARYKVMSNSFLILQYRGPDVDTRLYKGEMTKPGVQLNINVSSIIQDQKHEF